MLPPIRGARRILMRQLANGTLLAPKKISTHWAQFENICLNETVLEVLPHEEVLPWNQPAKFKLQSQRPGGLVASIHAMRGSIASRGTKPEREKASATAGKTAMKSSFAKLRKWFKSGSFKNSAPRKISSTRAHLALESLEVRTLLAGNALNDGPNVEFQITEDWNSGHTAELVLTNDDSSSYANWQFEFDYDRPITQLWNAQVESLGDGHYRLTPPEWDNTLDSGEQLAVGFVAAGSSSVPESFSFNGESVSGGSSPPENNPGGETGDGNVNDPDPSVAAPNTPTVSVQSDPVAGGYRVTFNLWSSTAAESWKLFEDGEVIHEASLAGPGTTPQSDSLLIADRTYGVYTYQAEVSNESGSTVSDELVYVAGGASTIEIAGVDQQSQALQMTIDQGTSEYTLSLPQSELAQFQVVTNNPRVMDVDIVGDQTLRVTGVEPGRASLRLTDAFSGATRYIGIRVRTADGELPGLPGYLSIGSVSEDTAGDLAFWQDFDSGNPLTNKFVDSRYIYLNGGPLNGWRTWGNRVSSYLQESLKLGMIPQFVYYNIPDGGESYVTNNEHIQSTEYMEAYFQDLQFALKTIAAEAGGELVQFILEPDFIGYLMQNANASASSLPAMASAAYSSGVLETGVDPQFDNTVTGLVQAINYTIGRYAPNVEFGWQFNLWASRGLETPIPANGIVHLTDTMGIEAGRAAIAREAELIAEYYIDAGVLSHGADFVSVDKYGLDGAAQNGAAADPAASTWFWNSDHWHNYLLVVKTLSQTTGRDMILWQIPVGHINDSLAVNPYDASGTFGQLENTTRKYEDSAPTFFLGDSFAATDNRFDYFATNEFGDEKLTVSGSTITWGSHMEEAHAAGVRQILFGAGVGISTDSIGSEPSDDYWWITQVQQYYQNPVAMDGSTIEPPPISNPTPSNPIEGEVGDPGNDGTIGTEDGLSPAVEGDYSGNGTVDAVDYVLWQDTLGSLTDLRADGNGNGVVDQDDYEFWRERFGNSASETSPGPDPPGEPGPVEPPAIQISDTTVAEGNSGNTVAIFTVTLSRAADQPVSVNFQTRSGTATAGEDYEETSGQVIFAASELSRTIEVRVFGDTMFEADEMFGVVLSDPVGAVLVERGTNSPLVDEQEELFWQEFGSDGFMNGVPVDDLVGVAIGTILNDDVEPPVDPPVEPPVDNSLVQVENVTLYEGDSGTAQAIFTVSLSATASETITVYYESQDGTATAGKDYQPVSGTLVFSPGETTHQVAVTIYGDTQFEADESFSLVVTADSEDSPALPAEDGGVSEVELPTVAAYFPEWGIYGRNYPIADVPAEKLTHFIYAFASLTSSGEMVLFDSYAAVEKRFAAHESVSGEADLWSYPAEDPRSEQTIWGNFNQVTQLKAQNPHLRTSIALGGWTLSGNFSSVLSTPSGRQTLADSIYNFLDTYTMFDGIDFDWEYPGGGGLGGNSESPQDGANYATLLSMVRERLDLLGSQRDRYYEISVASPAGSDKIANFNLAGLKEHVDFFNVMTYDFHGTWENTTGHQAALQNDPAGYDIQTAINLFLDAGVARENIILGAPLYTRAWSGVADGGDNGHAESASGGAPGTFESGNYDYKDLVSQIQSDTGGWELNWDDDAQAAYLYSGSQEIFSSFETPGTIALKSEWAQSMGLGGMMFWDLSSDATGGESLINAASESWFEGKSFQQIVSASSLTFDHIYGGNGVFDLVAEAGTTPTDPTQSGGGEIVVRATGTILNDDDDTEVIGELNYAEALQKSFLFYEANRSGDVEEATKRIDWRGDSGLADGYDGIYFGDRDSFSGGGTSNLQVGLQLDLTGGYHDAGDHGKFGLPLASTLSTLAWGGIAFAEGYEISGQTDELLDAIRWGTDYLLKAHVTDQEGNTDFFVVQVGDVSADHALWSGPESQTISRPAMAITREKPGSDVAGQTAAAMASASILFRQNGDVAYADQLLTNAEALYDFADTYRGKYSDSVTEVQGYYASWSGYGDDLTYGAAWLARAVEAAGGDGSLYRQKALALYDSEVGGLNNGWTHNWDDSSYAAAVVLAEDTGEIRIRQDVESWLNNWVQGGGGVQITEGGLRFISQWGSLRYAANTALLAGIYADNVSDPGGAYSKLAQDTIDYILGDNPLGMSYVVGVGETFPQQPHHRAASGVGWEDFRNGEPNEHILYGALVGGPKSASDYSYNDSRDDYISNEVAIDYNAGMTGALARSTGHLGGTPLTSGELDALPGVSDPTGGQSPPPSSTTPLPEEPVVPPQDPVDPPQDPPQAPTDPAPTPDPVEGPADSIPPSTPSGDYVDLMSWGMFHGSSDHTEHDELMGGRTPITTEALEAYNGLRAFLGLSAVGVEEVGQWAFANNLTNNSEAWGNDVKGVGLWYAMQGAKAGWIRDDAFDPQIMADIQRTARLGSATDVIAMFREFGHDGFADYLAQYELEEVFINTLKMEPHYAGWMHGRTHGWRSIEGVAIAHDVNHLTVLSHDQTQPFMNDTFDWPQWPALEVSHSGVIKYFQSMVALGNPVGQNLSLSQRANRYLAEESSARTTDTQLAALLDAGKIAAEPRVGSYTPSDHQGALVEPLVTGEFSQAVPSGDWWSSVHFAKFGDPFSAPLYVHPLTVQLNDSGLLVGTPAEQTTVVTGTTTAELKTPHQFDLQVELFAAGQQASSFALDSYSDWSFTGSWQGNSSSTAATLALASPMVWLADVELANLVIGFNTAVAEVQLADNVAQVAIAGRNYAVYASESVSWTQDAGGLRAVGDGLANVAVALLPDDRAETRELFAGPAARPVVATRFDYAQAEDPYSLELTYQYDLDTSLDNATTVVAYYPHLARLAGEVEGGSGGLAGDYNRDGTVDASDYVLWSDTRGQNVTPGTGADGVDDGVINTLDYAFWKTHFGATPLSRIGDAGYLSPRGTMSAIATDAIRTQIPARGVLPNLPDLLMPQQRETLAQLVRSDPQANDPQAYLDRWQDTYWSGKSMLKMMQLAQMADVAGEDQIRSAIVGAVQNTLDDWFSVEDVPGDRHFAYNETWSTLQGYPDSFGSAGDLNDHHFHYGYFVHAAALVGIYDPSWVAGNRDFVDVIIADVANVDASSNAFPRLRNFSPMAGHSWASGHGAFASGNNQESSSEAMNFATGVMLWGEVAGSQETTRLGQMLYSLEAEAISQYWFDKYGTTYPGEFDFESAGMIWGDGAAHATWFSAEVEMIKGINLLPFHGGSLYLSEAARDPAALLQEITELYGGEPDVWQGLLLQYEALVDPAAGLAHYTQSEFDYEEGQSPAHTYFWMTTLASLGSPTSAIRGNYALSAVFAQEGLVTYAAHNPTAETIDVHFSDGTTLQVAPYSFTTTTSSELPAGPPTDPPANDPADPGNAPPSLEDLEDGRTLMLVGQTFQDEYTDFIDGTGLTPAGSSHYGTFYLGHIEQGDDSPNAEFLDYVRDNDLGDYAMVALSLKDNTPAGGYGQMVNQGAADFNSNAIWEALDDIRNGAWDAQIDSFAQTMASRPGTQFLVRVGYEVSLLLFAYNGDEHVVDWLNQHANAGINVFENPDALGELDRWAFIDAYNHIVDRIELQAGNVEFGYHPVRGFNDTQWLYPGEENVDWVGFSVFNNDVCMEVSGTFNCPGERIDPNLAMSMDFARQQGHEIVIAESTSQNPAASNSEQFIEYLDRLDDVVQQYDVGALVYINSDWPSHGWGPEWGDSRVEVDPAVEAFFLETFGEGTRYIYADPLNSPVDSPVDEPGYDDPPAGPVDPPTEDPTPPAGGPDDSYNPPGEEVTYGFGLIEEGQRSAYDTTGFDQGEFVSNINFSHRATADPLVDPGNPNFWHAHDFFVNPSTDAYSTVESLMAVDGSSAQPANNESVYWAPSLVNETTGEYVAPLDSSIAYYRIRKPFDPARLEITPTGLSVIAGSAMPNGRQSIGIVAWNYIGSSERYEHLPIGDEWQDLPLQALIYFPTFWDGENLDSANHQSHMAYAGGNGGPSTHPYLLPELELQIHYGKIPRDAQLVLTSDYMTKDHPDYAPGWSLHADTTHLPWPEFDSDGNLYDGFERRVTDSMRLPIFAGTDGNPVRMIPTGVQQPFTPEPFYTYAVFPGQDNSEVPDTTAPILVTASPADGTVDVPVNTQVVLVFDEPVVAGEGVIHLMTGPADDPKTSPVETHTGVEIFSASDPRVSINGNRVTIDLANNLAYDTTYHLDIGSIGDAFLDLDGNGYQRDHADYNFMTTDGVGVDFTITWPGSDTWMGVGNTSTIYGQVNGAAGVGRLYATIQNVETGLYQRTDGNFGGVDYFEITVNAYDGHWFFLHTPAAGGTYRVEVFATDRAANITSRNTTFRVHGDPPNAPADLPVEDSPVSDPLANGLALELVAATTDVSLLVDPETRLAYVQHVDGEPILIRRSDDYWSGDIPLSRGGATLQAAARDALGRLRVLDVGEWGPFAWILDESGMFIGEEGPTDSSVVGKEGLFLVDLNRDGVIGEAEGYHGSGEP